jgi:hypothetical protein
MMIQAKRLKDNLKKIKANPKYGRISVKTHCNYTNGNIGNAWSIIEPLTIEQEAELKILDSYVKITKSDNPNGFWLVESY